MSIFPTRPLPNRSGVWSPGRPAFPAAAAFLLGLMIGDVPAQAAQAADPQAGAARAGSEGTDAPVQLRYSRFGKMVAKPGRRDAVIRILERNLDALSEAGCDLYMITVSAVEPDAIWVTEIWESREAHRNSLGMPGVRAAIAEARPMLTDEFEQVEMQVAGGLGVPQ